MLDREPESHKQSSEEERNEVISTLRLLIVVSLLVLMRRLDLGGNSVISVETVATFVVVTLVLPTRDVLRIVRSVFAKERERGSATKSAQAELATILEAFDKEPDGQP